MIWAFRFLLLGAYVCLVILDHGWWGLPVLVLLALSRDPRPAPAAAPAAARPSPRPAPAAAPAAAPAPQGKGPDLFGEWSGDPRKGNP